MSQEKTHILVRVSSGYRPGVLYYYSIEEGWTEYLSNAELYTALKARQLVENYSANITTMTRDEAIVAAALCS